MKTMGENAAKAKPAAILTTIESLVKNATSSAMRNEISLGWRRKYRLYASER